ncbi:hypothetical protein HDU76_013688 [Blyttiomyces sp. JEL0837]|nr:hypothetical protein HDU76_013688 [Blyttiomyces sp. JEL0837]
MSYDKHDKSKRRNSAPQTGKRVTGRQSPNSPKTADHPTSEPKITVVREYRECDDPLELQDYLTRATQDLPLSCEALKLLNSNGERALNEGLKNYFEMMIYRFENLGSMFTDAETHSLLLKFFLESGGAIDSFLSKVSNIDYVRLIHMLHDQLTKG